MPSTDALFGYVRKTSSAVIELGGHILSGASDAGARAAAEPAGVALGLVRLLQAFPAHAARGRLYLPRDVLGRHGGDVADVFAGRATTEVRAALAEMRAWRRPLSPSCARVPQAADLAPASVPAFLPVALVPALVARLDRAEPFEPTDLPQWRRQWVLWRAARAPARLRIVNRSNALIPVAQVTPSRRRCSETVVRAFLDRARRRRSAYEPDSDGDELQLPACR